MDDHSTPRPVITGAFKDHDSAKQGFEAARRCGYAEKEIDVLMFSVARSKECGNVDGKTANFPTKAPESAGLGAAIGGTVGAIAAVLTTVGTSVTIPWLGLVIAGPLAAALAGAGAGGAVGTLLGALVGLTIPDEAVKKYETCLRDGGILLGVRPRSADDAMHLATHWGSLRSGDAPATVSRVDGGVGI